MELRVLIDSGGKTYEPVAEDGLSLELCRRGSPGKLTFSVLKDEVLSFTEGDLVRLRVDGTDLFRGYVFTKGRSAGPKIDVTAYDQLRYLKNKDTIRFENMTASGRIRSIAERFGLVCGEIEETGVMLEDGTAENESLFDMALGALDETSARNGRLYALYDDYGKLAVRDVRNLFVNILIDAQTGESFDYTSSINEDTYNQVKLTYVDQDTKLAQSVVEKSDEGIRDWGVLQYHETVQEESWASAPELARIRLGQYNRKKRNLTVKNAFGDTRVRGGSLLAVSLDLGDMVLNGQVMMVEKVKHTFQNEAHRMDLTLAGAGEFIA